MADTKPQTENVRTDRMDRATLTAAVEHIRELPNTELNTKADVWATFRTEPDEVMAACEIASKERGVVMWKADRKEGFVSIALEDYTDKL